MGKLKTGMLADLLKAIARGVDDGSITQEGARRFLLSCMPGLRHPQADWHPPKYCDVLRDSLRSLNLPEAKVVIASTFLPGLKRLDGNTLPSISCRTHLDYGLKAAKKCLFNIEDINIPDDCYLVLFLGSWWRDSTGHYIARLTRKEGGEWCLDSFSLEHSIDDNCYIFCTRVPEV